MAELEGRTSMLQDILEQFKIEGRKQVVHCLVIISRLSPSIADKRDIGVHYEKLFKSCQQRYQGEGPTGLLLVYPQHCVHLIESPWEIIVQVIADLNQMQKEHGLLTESRLLSFSAHIPHRLYPQWAVRVLNLPALAKGEVYQTNEPLDVTVGSSLETLYKLGVHLSKMTQHQMKQSLDTLTTKLPHFLLQQDILEYYLQSEVLNSPSEFLQRYTKPTHITLDSEVVWPVPNRLFPYDD